MINILKKIGRFLLGFVLLIVLGFGDFIWTMLQVIFTIAYRLVKAIIGWAVRFIISALIFSGMMPCLDNYLLY